VGTAAVEERQLLKTLSWYDGFVIALANPGFLLGNLGYSVADLGGWGATLLWGISAAAAVVIMTLYTEMATMFPDKPGGFPLYAHEGWRKYFTLIGPVATFGYWIGWSVVLASFGLFVGQIAQGAWWPGEPAGTPLDPENYYFKILDVAVGLPHLIAAGTIIAVWAFNVFGIRIGMIFQYIGGALLMLPLFVFMFMGYLNGDFTTDNLTWGMLDDDGAAWGGMQLALVWLWIMAWSAWGVDACATFAPEYKDTVRDTKLALRSASLFSLGVYILLPLGLVGSVGEEMVANYDYVGALEQLTGSTSLTNFFVFVIIISFVISMNTATADGGRALYGIARDDMTIKQLYHLNRWNVPGRAMTLDMFVNLFLLFIIGNILGIIVASNIGYVLAHFFALSAFILLRKDRPDWPRPIKLGAIWVPIAAAMAAGAGFLTIMGVGWLQIAGAGYGGNKEKLIGFAVLGIAILLYLFRRIVQDGERPHWREEPPLMPGPGPIG
jgi:amino acid transporter